MTHNAEQASATFPDNPMNKHINWVKKLNMLLVELEDEQQTLEDHCQDKNYKDAIVFNTLLVAKAMEINEHLKNEPDKNYVEKFIEKYPYEQPYKDSEANKIHIIRPTIGGKDKYQIVGKGHCGGGTDACYGQLDTMTRALKEAQKRFPNHKITVDFKQQLNTAHSGVSL